MALPATGVIELRTTGNDANAGGFKPGGSGTDRSQADSPFVTFDGVTITATTAGASATITIVGYTVVAGDVDNYVRISGGTNFTAGLYHITSVNTGANTWTLDRTATTGVGAAMTGRMGGAILTVAQAFSDAVALNTIYVGPGTYTLTASAQLSQTSLVMIGYNSSRSEYLDDETIGTRPLITTATNSVELIRFTTADKDFLQFHNLRFSNTAGTRDNAFESATNIDIRGILLNKVQVDGCLHVMTVAVAIENFHATRCEVKNTTGDSFNFANNGAGMCAFRRCYIHDGTGIGIETNNSNHQFAIDHCVIARMTSHGLAQLGGGTGSSASHIMVTNSVFDDNGGSGIAVTSASNDTGVYVDNCIFYDNGAYGVRIDNPRSPAMQLGNHNAYGANATAARLNYMTGAADVTLTADPFTNRAAGDYTLNNTAGGGAALKGAGSPTLLP